MFGHWAKYISIQLTHILFIYLPIFFLYLALLSRAGRSIWLCDANYEKIDKLPGFA